MKKLLVKCRYILITIGVFCCTATTLAQPYFIDPITCIPANIETSLTEYKLAANGFSITDIIALGDLEIISISESLPTVNDIIIKVRSYNKGRNAYDDCDGYLKDKKYAGFGFGKGVIRARYGSEKCINFIDQEIFKLFKETPPIMGPLCVGPGDIVTYSVCPMLTVNLNDNIGIDDYFWNEEREGFPPGLLELYRSADQSSITFKVTGDWQGGSLQCRFGRCNRGFSAINIGVKTKPPQSVLINSSTVFNTQNICVPTSSNTISLIVTAPVGSAYSYTWSTSNSSWSFGNNGAATTNANSGTPVQLNINESAGEIYLTTIGGCGGYTAKYIINRQLTPPLIIKRADTINCIQAGSNIIFSVNNAGSLANLSNINFNWSVPQGWQINGAVAGPIISVTVGQGSGTVSVSSIGCSASNLSLFVKVKPAKPSAISGQGCIAASASLQSYSVANTPGYSYFWNNTASWTSSGIVNNSISYNASTLAGMPNIISVKDTALGGCYSDTVQKIVYTQPFADSINITGCWNIGVLDSNNPFISPWASAPIFSINSPQAGTTYTWDVSPNNGGSLSSTIGNSVTFNANGRPGTYNITVTAQNSICGVGNIKTRQITLQPNGHIAHPQGYPNAFNDVLHVTGYSVGSTFRWFNAANINLPAPNTFPFYTFAFPSVNGNRYFVEVKDHKGCATILSDSSKNFAAARISNNINKKDIEIIAIIPNPASEAFSVVLPVKASNTTVSIYNSKGALVKQQICKGGNNKFNTANWANGEYLIKLTNTKGETVTKKLIISK